MSPIYGEGAEHARDRLIREIRNEHGPTSRVDTGEFHLQSSDYRGLEAEVTVEGTTHRLPKSRGSERVSSMVNGTSKSTKMV